MLGSVGIMANTSDKGYVKAHNNVRVLDLIPGDVVSLPLADLQAVFVGVVVPHPLHPTLALVIWRAGNPYGARGKWYHDALSLDQIVGNTWPTSDNDRTKALRWALNA
jgi:hypothetical protein